VCRVLPFRRSPAGVNAGKRRAADHTDHLAGAGRLASRDDAVAIVRAVAGLARSLGITSTAEGVETTEQLAILRAEGCNEIQGYLFNPPRPAAEVESMLNVGEQP
jgi:EAL domain-containing protein (putative c-di-GMP-specific phosphodiesterase class I)